MRPGRANSSRPQGVGSVERGIDRHSEAGLEEIPMLWITRSHVHVDRVACPWLITRFIDSHAEFLFVPVGELERTVKETGATPFDAPGVELGHTPDGRCSFESIIKKYELKDPALLRLAAIVHAADVAADSGKDAIAPGL